VVEGDKRDRRNFDRDYDKTRGIDIIWRPTNERKTEEEGGKGKGGQVESSTGCFASLLHCSLSPSEGNVSS
jgi:hypothetical protein